MKKLLLTIATLLFITLGVNAQNYNSDLVGIWGGTLERTDTEDETYALFSIYREAGRLVCARQFKNDDGLIYNSTKSNSSTIAQSNNLTYSWVNSGGIWSESQTYFLTLTTDGDNDEVLYVYHVRIVNNDTADDNDDDVWGYEEVGLLYKK